MLVLVLVQVHVPSGLAPDPSGLAPDPSGLAPDPSGLAPDPSGLAPEPSGWALGAWPGLAGPGPAPGPGPGPGTYLDRSGPRFCAGGCPGELEMWI